MCVCVDVCGVCVCGGMWCVVEVSIWCVCACVYRWKRLRDDLKFMLYMYLTASCILAIKIP